MTESLDDTHGNGSGRQPADLFRQADAVFDAALNRPARQRRAFVQRACAGDAALCSTVIGLLDAYDASDGFLDTPAAAVGAPLLPGWAEPATTARVGSIGPFRIVREIGRGGMGAVYLGERDDGQFHQRVALKLVHTGSGDATMVTRFLAERRIVASLEHANIARLVDGGLTADNVPWFAMEYVEGQPITEYCAVHRLGLEARLGLFLHVCSAVEYAHRHLVVHRDLKPANVLVTGDGLVKLLDFGIARLLDMESDATSQPPLRRATPAYASPEQLKGEPGDATSDVYSLGVLLHELVTGRHPVPTRTAPPSSHVKTLRGNIDAIVLKALRRDPAQRYATVSHLADDLRRHLTGRAVAARATQRRLRLAAGLAVAVVAITLVVADRDRPDAIAARALYQEGLRSYYRDGENRKAYGLFTASLADDPGNAMAAFHAGRMAGSLWTDSATKYLLLADSLAGASPERDRLLIRAHTANLFHEPRAIVVAESLAVRYPREAAGAVQYGLALLSDGRFNEAVTQLRRAIDLDPAIPERPRTMCHACEAFNGIIDAGVLMDSLPAALTTAEEWAALQPRNTVPWERAADILDRLDRHEDAAAARLRVAALRPGDALLEVGEARMLLRAGDFAGADRILAVAAASADPAIATAALWLQVISLRHQGRFEEAEASARRHALIRTDGAGNPTPVALLALAAVMLDAGRPGDAVTAVDAAIAAVPDYGRASRSARDHAWLRTLRAAALVADGQTHRAAEEADSIEIIGARSAYGRDPRLHFHVRGLLHRDAGNDADAETHFRAAIYSATGGYTRTNLELARVLMDQDRPVEAVAVLRSALRAPLDGPALYVTRTELKEAMALAFHAAAQPDSAAMYYRRVLAAWQDADTVLAERRADAALRLQRLR